MSARDPLDDVGRASRKSALISAVGFVLVLAAIGYAATQLRAIERQRASVAAELASLSGEVVTLRDSVAALNGALEGARCALSSSRAAINAFHNRSYRLAVRLYDEALACDSNNAYLLNLKAYALFRLDDLDAAIVAQRRSVSAAPDYAWGHFDLARFLCASGDLASARAEIRLAASLRPDIASIAADDGEFRSLCGGALLPE